MECPPRPSIGAERRSLHIEVAEGFNIGPTYKSGFSWSFSRCVNHGEQWRCEGNARYIFDAHKPNIH